MAAARVETPQAHPRRAATAPIASEVFSNFNAEKSPQHLGIASLDGFVYVDQGAHRLRVQRAGRARSQPAKGMAGPAVRSCISRALMYRMSVHSL